MRRSLTQLITDDLAELARMETNYIASEESIRFLMEMYKNNGALKNVVFMHKDKLLSYLENRSSEDKSFLTKAGHYQFFIEVGVRSKAKQREPATIHYCALDLFIRPGLPPLAFVADHFRLSDGYYEEFKRISKQMSIQFIVAGKNEFYQTDSVHCPVFTLMHLLLTAKDENLLSLLENQVPAQKTLEVVDLTWDNLPPEYVLYPQSLTTIFNYVHKIKAREGSASDMPSSLLSSTGYEKRVSPFLFPIHSHDNKLNNKMRSKGVKYLAAEFAGKAVLELERSPVSYTDAMLIDLCYKEQYPLVHSVLKMALALEAEYPYKDKYGIQSHPMFELAFYHAGVLESCLSKPNFYKIFTDKALLTLMQKGFLDPHQLFQKLTTVTSSIEIEQQPVNQLVGNLPACESLVEVLGSETTVDNELLVKLLFSSKMKSFFQNQTLADLFKNQKISLSMIDQILVYKINKTQFEKLESDEEKMDYLTKLFSLKKMPAEVDATPTVNDVGANSVKNSSVNSMNSVVANTVYYSGANLRSIPGMQIDKDEVVAPKEDELFSVPEIGTVTVISANTSQKPGINVGLLAQSMAKGGILKTATQPEN